MRTMIYQNRLALDYLLAEEGSVCGKFNSSECCVEIDEHSEAIKNIATNIRKLAHVPVQRWTPLFKSNWWDNLLTGEWWKKALIIAGLSVAGFLFLPCLIPCFVRLTTSVVQNMPLIEELQTQNREKIARIRVLQADELEEDQEGRKPRERRKNFIRNTKDCKRFIRTMRTLPNKNC